MNHEDKGADLKGARGCEELLMFELQTNVFALTARVSWGAETAYVKTRTNLC